MRIVVIGGGLGGCASAARLAKLGHEVVLLEGQSRLGGAVGEIEDDGFRWQRGPHSTLLPAVLRDLFRKSGRPAEREFDLQPLAAREHRWPDGVRARMPGGSRAAQLEAVAGLGQGVDSWARYVDGLGPVWEEIRRGYLERPRHPRHDTPALKKLLGSRRSLARQLQRALPNQRLREIAGFDLAASGQHWHRSPAWAGLAPYLEQRFGIWTIADGFGTLAEVLTRRLQTRKVAIETGTSVRDLVLRNERCVAVRTSGGGEIDADAVVVAIDPQRLPTLAQHRAWSGSRSVIEGPTITHLGLAVDAPLPDLAEEVVLHGDPLVVVHAPATSRSWTVHAHGPHEGDILDLLRARGLDLRDLVTVRVDRAPGEVCAYGSPYGIAWRGRRTITARVGPTTPIRGVYAAGAHATPGAGVPFVGLSAALVAQVIGPESTQNRP